jgi:GNAT superfamily N-acetyltransferase
MEIEEVDARTASDEVLLRFHELELVCHEELQSGQPWRARDEGIAFHRFLPETTTIGHWLADGGHAVLWMHGPTATFCEVLVDPQSRRQGLGTALLERVVERCRELGVETLRGEHMTTDGAAFCAHIGAVDEQRVVRSLLDLPAAELPEPRPSEGFRLVNWLARVPDEHLDSYVRARVAMDDAPAPEGMDWPVWDAEKVRASEESLRLREREMRLTVAMDNVGEIGSFTELRHSAGSVLGFTDDTGTVAEHRGKGLARAVKRESLRWLRDDHPEIKVVTTRNAEENAVMRGLNVSLGFRPTVVETTAGLAVRPG